MYEGFFAYDKKNGPGVLRYSNGDIYVGEFVSEKRHGFGQFYDSKKGTLYEVLKDSTRCGRESGS